MHGSQSIFDIKDSGKNLNNKRSHSFDEVSALSVEKPDSFLQFINKSDIISCHRNSKYCLSIGRMSHKQKNPFTLDTKCNNTENGHESSSKLCSVNDISNFQT